MIHLDKVHSVSLNCLYHGGLAQLGERLPYKQDVSGSIPLTSIGSVV